MKVGSNQELSFEPQFGRLYLCIGNFSLQMLLCCASFMPVWHQMLGEFSQGAVLTCPLSSLHVSLMDQELRTRHS